MHIMTCPSVKAWTHYVFQCVYYICTGLCFIPVPWSLVVLALIKQLGSEWEHIKNQSPLWADGSSLWQGQSTWTQACYSCAMLRKLGLGCLGCGCFFFSLTSTLKISNKYTQIQTYILPKTTRFASFLTFIGLEACCAGGYSPYIYNSA